VRTGEQWNGQFPLLKKSGEVFLALVTNTPLYDDNGEMVGVVGVSVDARRFSSYTSIGYSLDPFDLKHKHRQPHGIPFGSSLTDLVLYIFFFLSHVFK
jgi:hypothetical protein